MTAERWATVPGHPTYEVSDLGRARSLGTRQEGRILRGDINPNGYVRVTFLMGSRTKKRSYLVHRLVAAAFCLKPEGCGQVNHIDGHRANNVATNLEWVTGPVNVRHGARRRKATAGDGPFQPFVWHVQARQVTKETAEALPEYFRGSEGYWTIKWTPPSGKERYDFMTDKDFKSKFENPNPGFNAVQSSPVVGRAMGFHEATEPTGRTAGDGTGPGVGTTDAPLNVGLRAALENLLAQVVKFCDEQGEADFYTGEAIAALRADDALTVARPEGDK